MLGNFTSCLDVTLGYEGGWSDHPKDPGGATMKGVTLAVYRQYRPGASKADLRAITEQEVGTIYRRGYWTPIKGDDLPAGIDLATFDYGVNSGVSRASKALQSVAGVVQDGNIGTITIGAVKQKNGKEVIQHLCGKRLSFVRGLKTFSTFGKGWSRRIAEVEARAVAMWLTAGSVLTETARAELKQEAETATDAASVSTQRAGKAVAGGGGASVSTATLPDEPNWWLIAAIVAFALLLIVGFIARSRHNRDRAEAYAMVAAE